MSRQATKGIWRAALTAAHDSPPARNKYCLDCDEGSMMQNWPGRSEPGDRIAQAAGYALTARYHISW